jgi:hypothetical protein
LGGAKIRSQAIWSADGLTVTASEIGRYVERSWNRDAVYLRVKNDGSSPMLLRCTALLVNGAAVQPELLLDAQPGATTDGRLLFDRSSLYDMQIIHVGEISLELAAFDAASGTETARSGRITLKTNKAKKAETPSFMYKTEALVTRTGSGFRLQIFLWPIQMPAVRFAFMWKTLPARIFVWFPPT